MRMGFQGWCAGVLVVLVVGCASEKGALRQSIDLPVRSPEVNRGEPVPHAEMAGDLAEMTLALNGIDCRGWARSTSFMEGRYTVTFQPADPTRQATYSVALDAGNSEILWVRKTEPAGGPKAP
jgi:hypothetical protein